MSKMVMGTPELLELASKVMRAEEALNLVIDKAHDLMMNPTASTDDIRVVAEEYRLTYATAEMVREQAHKTMHELTGTVHSDENVEVHMPYGQPEDMYRSQADDEDGRINL